MEVAPRYKLMTLLTLFIVLTWFTLLNLFILLKLLYTALHCTLAFMPLYFDRKGNIAIGVW